MCLGAPHQKMPEAHIWTSIKINQFSSIMCISWTGSSPIKCILAFIYTNSYCNPSVAHIPTFCPLAFSLCRMRSPWHFHFLSCQLRSLPGCERGNTALQRLLLLAQRASCGLLHTAASPTTLFSARPNLPDFGKFLLDPGHNTKCFSPKASFLCPFISQVGDFNSCQCDNPKHRWYLGILLLLSLKILYVQTSTCIKHMCTCQAASCIFYILSHLT